MRLHLTSALAVMAVLALQAPAAAFAQDAAADTAVASIPGPSQNVTIVTDWVLASGDNGGLPYIVIDKVGAELFLFDGGGQLLGRTPALLGAAPGDDSAPGIGDRELRNIPPAERTTPAGRFIARFGPAAGHQKVLWVDFASAVSLHAVVTGNRKERRLERLKSPTPEDNRITYGCINVPAHFYNELVKPLLADTAGVVYIIPEMRSLNEVFWAARQKSDSAGL